jgi:hypothetical protein
MMETQDNNQLELFSQSDGDSSARANPANRPFAAYIRRYEKAILIIIVVISTSLVSFSLGVNRGRRIAQATYQETSVISQQLPQKQQLPKRAQVVLVQQNAPEVQKIQESVDNYTIQIASYKSKTLAQKEAQVLKKRGLVPRVLSRGSYTVLCIGNFPNKKEAQPVLSELKKTYFGCYLRRL